MGRVRVLLSGVLALAVLAGGGFYVTRAVFSHEQAPANLSSPLSSGDSSGWECGLRHHARLPARVSGLALW